MLNVEDERQQNAMLRIRIDYLHMNWYTEMTKCIDAFNCL